MKFLKKQLQSLENQILLMLGLGVVAVSMMFGVKPSPAAFIYMAIFGIVVGTAIKYYTSNPVPPPANENLAKKTPVNQTVNQSK